MIEPSPIPGAALNGAREEAKAYLRIETADEDALIDRMVAAALSLCEAFTGLVLIERDFVETVAGACEWRSLSLRPVRAITGVARRSALSPAEPLPVESYAIDIAADGRGLVRVTDAGGAARVEVGYRAGIASGWAGIPEALRQGTLRLVAHSHAHRDDAKDAGPPAAVAALWRPFREMRI